jgi:hypothetical protein
MYQCAPHWTDFRDIWFLETFMKVGEEDLNLVKIGQKCQILFMKTKVHFIAAGDVK